MVSRSLNDNYDNRIDTHVFTAAFLNESWIDYATTNVTTIWTAVRCPI